MNMYTGLYILLVFLAVFLLAQVSIGEMFGDASRVRRRMRERLAAIDPSQTTGGPSLFRERYLRDLSPIGRRLEGLPGMAGLAALLEQAGSTMLPHRLLMLAAALGFGGALLILAVTSSAPAALAALVLLAWLPYFGVVVQRRRRLDRIEEQLPDALDIMKRALRAGHPFAASLQLVSEDLVGPVAQEFGLVYSDLNYGSDLRRALTGMLDRAPSITLMAVTTAVMVQKETGGNLAEIFEQIAAVVRGRFRFNRRLRSLSAEGRLSAWILLAVPVILIVLLTLSSPQYLPVLFESETGRRIVLGGGILATIGVIWIRRILRIEV